MAFGTRPGSIAAGPSVAGTPSPTRNAASPPSALPQRPTGTAVAPPTGRAGVRRGMGGRMASRGAAVDRAGLLAMAGGRPDRPSAGRLRLPYRPLSSPRDGGSPTAEAWRDFGSGARPLLHEGETKRGHREA